jgi:hypothetical protein
METEMDGTTGPAWGRRSGFVALPTPAAASTSADSSTPLAALHRYAWGYDERATDILRSVFTDDATFEGRIASAGRGTDIGPIRGRDAIVDWLAESMKMQDDQRRHCILNHLTIAESSSTVELQAYLLLTAARSGSVHVVTTGFYRAWLTRTPSEPWRIRRLFAGFDSPY